MPSSRSGWARRVLRPNKSTHGECFMRMAPVALAVAVVAAAASGPSEARIYVHKHRYCGYGLHYDYTHSNALSPTSYIYPAANWGPFFQCHMYYGPVYLSDTDRS